MIVETVENDWNRLYAEFPEVYDAFVAVPHEPAWFEMLPVDFELRGKDVLDIGSGTGASTRQVAAFARSVIGVEPFAEMRAVAAVQGPANVDYRSGELRALPVEDGSVDAITGITTVFWPARESLLAFAPEAQRVLRRPGFVVLVNTRYDAYGGELADVIGVDLSEPGEAFEQTAEELGFIAFDYESTQDYGTTERLVATYGFIFGRAAIEAARDRSLTQIRWQWRMHVRRYP